MAAGANPMMGMIMSALMQRSGAGQAAPGGAGGVGQQGAPGAPAAYAQQVSELKRADPGGLQKQLKSIKQILAIMAVENMERLPNVSGQIYKIIPMFDRVLKEVQQAGSVDAAVRNPIQMGAAMPPQPEGGPSGAPTF